MEYWEKTKGEDDKDIELEFFNSENRSNIFQRDRARIIHSASFRRLQSKTQVLGIGDGDFYRTRLTHSLEVAQIGSGISEILREKYSEKKDILDWIPSTHLIETIGLCHDIGHPPFGHGGEKALHKKMKTFGGFEGNGQTLRIITKLGEYSENHGMDLSRRSILGIIKYPEVYSILNNNNSISKPPKCYFDDEKGIFDWIFKDLPTKDKELFSETISLENKHKKTKYKSFDTSIMELADDISYGIHDLEDALSLKLITLSDWKINVLDELNNIEKINKLNDFSNNIIIQQIDNYTRDLFSDSNKKRKSAISKLVKHFILSIEVKELNCFETKLLDLNAILPQNEMYILKTLKDFIYNILIKKPEVQILEYKGQKMISEIFDVLKENPESLLPKSAYKLYENSENKERVICDHISGMTDNYATKLYHKLFTPSIGSVFDKL